MDRIPPNISSKLKCSMCDHFLQNPPLMVSADGTQVCGKCFEDIPEDERPKFVREPGLEAIMEFFRDQHPPADGAIESADSKSVAIPQENSEVKSKLKFTLKDCKSTTDNSLLKYSLEILGTNQNLQLTSTNNPPKCISIQMEGTLALRNHTPNVIYSNLRVDELSTTNNNVLKTNFSEHKYETISSRRLLRQCVNCEKPLTREVYHCALHHEACNECKGKVCQSCMTHVGSIPNYHCKNACLGCKVQENGTEIATHETDCEFNNFRCPVKGCRWHGVLKEAKVHVKNEHADKIEVNHEVIRGASNGDDDWLMCAHDNIFKCRYYYYKEYVDLVVVYLGAHENACKFRYEVELTVNGRSLRKSCVCMGWNGVALEKGVTITKGDLQEMMGQNKNYKFDFNYALRIYETNKYFV